MRYTLQAVAMAGLIGAGLVAPSVAEAACSGGLSGSFGVLVNGADSSTGAVRLMTGVLNFNQSNCAVSGTVSTAINGVVNTFVPVFAGTYTLNSNNTYTINVTASGTPMVFAVAYSASAMAAFGIEQDIPNSSSSYVTAEIDLQAQVIKTTVTTTTTTSCAIPLLCILLPPTSTTTTTPAPSLTYNNATLNGSFAASCFSTDANTDLNLVTFNGANVNGAGTITMASSTDAFNNGGTTAVSNYSGSYAVLTNGLFGGAVNVGGTAFSYVGVIDNQQTEIQYFYFNSGGGVTACTGRKV